MKSREFKSQLTRRTSDELSIDQEFFRRHANSPKMWELSAVTLRFASEVLLRQIRRDIKKIFGPSSQRFTRPSLHTVWLMLCGLTIENLAKAVLVSKGSPIDESERIKKSLKTHKLVNLVRGTGIRLSKGEEVLLRRLSEFIEWTGRYPVPLSSSRMSITLADGNRQLLGASLIGEDAEAFRQMADRLEALLPGKRVRSGMRLSSRRKGKGFNLKPR